MLPHSNHTTHNSTRHATSSHCLVLSALKLSRIHKSNTHTHNYASIQSPIDSLTSFSLNLCVCRMTRSLCGVASSFCRVTSSFCRVVNALFQSRIESLLFQSRIESLCATCRDYSLSVQSCCPVESRTHSAESKSPSLYHGLIMQSHELILRVTNRFSLYLCSTESILHRDLG